MQLVISKTTLNHAPKHIMKYNIWGGGGNSSKQNLDIYFISHA